MEQGLASADGQPLVAATSDLSQLAAPIVSDEVCVVLSPSARPICPPLCVSEAEDAALIAGEREADGLDLHYEGSVSEQGVVPLGGCGDDATQSCVFMIPAQ